MEPALRIDLSEIDRTQFNVTPGVIDGETCYLVTPKNISVAWTPETLIYRSSVWNAAGEPVSLSLPKFFNWHEMPHLSPAPGGMGGWIRPFEKIDGSTLIVSLYKRALITRTRGGFDVSHMDNSDEVGPLLARYPNIFKHLCDVSGDDGTAKVSMIFEWVSPRNAIVLKYPEPDLYLTAIIDHSDYSMVAQGAVDSIARVLGLRRPRRYNFDTIREMLDHVVAMKGQEGICVYYNADQSIRKIKSAEYLALHQFKNSCNLERVMDLFLGLGEPSYRILHDKISETFDFECAELASDFAQHVIAASVPVSRVITGVRAFAAQQSGLSRREAAAAIIAEYDGLERPLCFQLVSGELRPADVRRVYASVLGLK